MRRNLCIALAALLSLAGCENLDAMQNKRHRYRELAADEPRALAKRAGTEDDAAGRRSARSPGVVYGAVSARPTSPEDDPGKKPGPYVLPKFATVPVISIEDSRRILTDGGLAKRREAQMAEDRTR